MNNEQLNTAANTARNANRHNAELAKLGLPSEEKTELVEELLVPVVKEHWKIQKILNNSILGICSVWAEEPVSNAGPGIRLGEMALVGRQVFAIIGAGIIGARSLNAGDMWMLPKAHANTVKVGELLEPFVTVEFHVSGSDKAIAREKFQFETRESVECGLRGRIDTRGSGWDVLKIHQEVGLVATDLKVQRLQDSSNASETLLLLRERGTSTQVSA